MTDSALHEVLGDIGTINMFFAVEVARPGSGWSPIPQLWARPETVAARTAAVRTRLSRRTGCPESDVEQRTAASIFYQGLAARLLSPLIGAALCHGRMPDPGRMHWRATASAPLTLAVGDGPGIDVRRDRSRPEEIAGLLHDRALTGVLAPISDALRSRIKVAPRLLWGNAASALAGAVLALGRARPVHADDARVVADLLLAREPLADTGGFAAPVPDAFERTTCCLYYRLPGCGKCGDCALLRTGTQAQ